MSVKIGIFSFLFVRAEKRGIRFLEVFGLNLGNAKIRQR